MRFQLPKWYDLHAHFRQGNLPKPLIKDHLKMGCAGILAMPNTSPPLAKVFESDDLSDFWSVEGYYNDLLTAGADQFDHVVVPLYLTAHTTPQMIESGAQNGFLKACKYYPPHGTTGAEFGAPLPHFFDNGVLEAMEAHGVILCIHGEMHALTGPEYFDTQRNAEIDFYENYMPQLVERFPNLKIVCEHLTTQKAAEFVKAAGPNVAATITPQHLLYTVSHLLQGLKYHLFCLPLLKFEADRQALRQAVSDPDNRKFFAGTDSAPHTDKMTACGCAAGCYTGGIAPQLYAMAFEDMGFDFSDTKTQEIFKQFLCFNGAEFYGLPISDEFFTLEKKEESIAPLHIGDSVIKPLPLGLSADGKATLPWRIVD